MTFKRIASYLAAAVFSVTVLFMPRAEAATSGTVTINGAVPLACNVTVTPQATASDITDISAGDTNRLVATVNESCNDPAGYKVTVAGTHSHDHTGLFVDSVSNATHPFTIAYDGASVASGGVVTDVTAPGINLNKNVNISYNANAGLTPTAGYTYAETLTFTIAAK